MRAVVHTNEGEVFSLLDQGAQDNGRYDILKDLQRLEQMVKRNLADEAVEVRYKTALLQTVFNGHSVALKNQAAQDIARYDFLKDLEKLEALVVQRPEITGYAVLITNDRGYWNKPQSAATVDENFRIHQGRMIHGRLSWKNASGGTTENREEPIHIRGEYRMNWQPFIELGLGRNEIFQMLVVQVAGIIREEF